jgi:hypothetical protein
MPDKYVIECVKVSYFMFSKENKLPQENYKSEIKTH